MSVSGQLLDREPGHESDVTSSRGARRYSTENVSNTENQKSPNIDFLPFSPEEQVHWQERTPSMSFEANSAERRENETQAEEGKKHSNAAGSGSGRPQQDEEQQEDIGEYMDLEDTDDDDYESQPSSESPTPVRRNKPRNSARRVHANSIDQTRHSANHQSKNDLLRTAFLKSLPENDPSQQRM